MQTCPGFLLKSLLASPRNLLEICSVKFVDTLLLKLRWKWCDRLVACYFCTFVCIRGGRMGGDFRRGRSPPMRGRRDEYDDRRGFGGRGYGGGGGG